MIYKAVKEINYTYTVLEFVLFSSLFSRQSRILYNIKMTAATINPSTIGRNNAKKVKIIHPKNSKK